jgi:hypothetical protein
MWERLCEAFGLDDLRTDERAATNDARVRNRELVEAAIAGVIAPLSSGCDRDAQARRRGADRRRCRAHGGVRGRPRAAGARGGAGRQHLTTTTRG